VTPPISLLGGFRDVRVLVIGDAMLDTYLHGSPRELCREAPVPIVDVRERRDVPGGAANTAANLAALGARTDLVALVGDDREGEVLDDGLRASGVDPAAVVVEPGRQTLSKQRVIAADQMVVRWDVGTTDGAGSASEERIRRAIRDRWASIGCVVISDYAYGVLTPRVRATLAELRRHRPEVVVVVDAKQPTLYRDLAPTVVKPNYAEAVRLLGLITLDAGRVDQIAARGHDVLEPTGAAFAAITLDRDGAMLFGRDRRTFRSHARPGGDVRSAGAGDTFVAAIALAFANGADPGACLDIAQAASTAVLGRDGTACCTLDELTLQLAAERKVVDDIGAAVTWAELQRARGRRLVFTNGCFDILHRGHTAYLEEARSLGDALLVALNDDASVRRLKGPTRPVNTLEDRAEVLAGLSSVDLVVPFADDRPDRLIEHIRPDVFVKGGDYTEDRLPEAALVRELGGEVQILPLVSDRSTSGLIAKLRDSGSAIDPPASVRPNGSADVGVSPRALRGTVLPSDASPGRHPRRETP
jgi:D-beta-D-heptose 7-phosphate kinase/D-beta-D-heptose 1-phosphate adenosyltransferase